MPLRTTAIPLSARIVSNRAGNLLSRSRIRYRADDPASCRSMTRLRAVCVTPGAGRVGGSAQDPDAAGGVFDDREDVQVGCGECDCFDEVDGQ
jgi:hypothetical protein